MSHKRVAALYLRANAPLDKNFKLSLEGYHALKGHFVKMNGFAGMSLGSYGHSLEAMSWFVENSHDLQKLISQIGSTFNLVDSILEEEQKTPDAQKHSKQLKDDFAFAKKFYTDRARINIYKMPKRDFDMMSHLKTVDIDIHNADKTFRAPIQSSFISTVALLQETLNLLHNAIPFLKKLADKITSENAMIASEQIQGGGVGGFFKKLFRRAGLTLESRLTEPLIQLKHNIEATGIEHINPSIIEGATLVYARLAEFEASYQFMLNAAKHYLTEQDKPFFQYLVSNAHWFQHYQRGGYINLEEVASDTALVHVAHQQAKKFSDIWTQITQDSGW